MNIIVPTDFSAISVNAAQFATRMLAGQYEATLILYHVYGNENEGAEALAALRELKDRLVDEAVVKIEIAAEQSNDFIDAL